MSKGIPSTGALIFLSIKPIIRLVIPASAGYLITVNKILPPSGTRSASLIILNVTLPALLFSKIVPSFTPDNISALLPIIVVAAFYQGISFVFGTGVRAFTQTPQKFRYGLLSAWTYSNWGDLPTAVVQTITASAPFAGAVDTDLGIAYVAIFILVAYITMFPLMGIKLISMDYTSGINLVEERAAEEAGGRRKWINRLRRGKPMRLEYEEGNGKDKVDDDEKRRSEEQGLSTTATPQTDSLDTLLSSPDLAADKPPSPTPPHSTRRRILHSILSFLRSLISPPTIALLSALVIAVVAPLKALFVADPSTTSTFHPTAPDGNPPLDVIYTAIAFVGAASVPLGLIVLGASLAKMKLPRPIYRLPLASIAWMAIFKLILLPILGTLLVGALVRAGWVREDERVLRFVLIYFSACPTATTQIAYTQIFAGEGGEDNADLLASYLIAQYCIFAFSSVTLTALTLNSIF